ncbi:regulator of DNA class I crossover intermediates 1 [Rhynchocyon petersi]
MSSLTSYQDQVSDYSERNPPKPTRVLIKQEKRKQKEYFEKKRLKSKMKLLGVLSPAKNPAVSLDLLNLYIVNQISCKKDKSETVRKPIHVNMNRDIKMPLKKHDLELPMSPHCAPSKLCLEDTENNIHDQRIGNKEELGSVQSSQVMDSHGEFKTQFNETENCRFPPPSFSAEFSSSSHIPKQNSTPRIAPSPWKAAYEKPQNEQLSNVSYLGSLLPTLNGSQDVLSSSSKAPQFATLFERFKSPENGNVLAERPAMIRREDCGFMNERRVSDFITEKQAMQPVLGENKKGILNCVEDVNQSIPMIVSENCDTFISQNMINILNLDQKRIKENFDKYDCVRVGDTGAVAGSSKYDSSDRCLRSIFTIPKLTSTFTKTSYPEKYQSHKTYQKEYKNSERKNLNTSFKKHCYSANSEKTDLDSPQSSVPSSQSTDNYSPRETDSCLTSSSEMPSEDEDPVLQSSEDTNRRFIKTKKMKNIYVKHMSKLAIDEIIENDAKIQNSYKFSVKNNTDQFPQSQCKSAYILQSKTSDNCILQVAKCDAWVQTEMKHATEEKSDVAIQCDIISKGNCRCDTSSFSNVENCSKTIKADTTGGQEILKNN